MAGTASIGIGGSPSAAGDAAVLTVLDPATDEVLGTVATGTDGDVHSAVVAAAKAAPGWARTAAADRAELLGCAARLLRDHVDELGELTTREMGKPLADARGGVLAGISTVEQYAELGPLHRGRSLQGSWGATDLMVFEPRGLAAVITP